MAARQITNENEKYIFISYLNDAFCLFDTNDHITERDTIVSVWVKDKTDERTVMVHLITEQLEPLIGIFFEWRRMPNGRFGCDRMMWIDSEMSEILGNLNIGRVNTLFGPKNK